MSSKEYGEFSVKLPNTYSKDIKLALAIFGAGRKLTIAELFIAVVRNIHNAELQAIIASDVKQILDEKYKQREKKRAIRKQISDLVDDLGKESPAALADILNKISTAKSTS